MTNVIAVKYFLYKSAA